MFLSDLMLDLKVLGVLFVIIMAVGSLFALFVVVLFVRSEFSPRGASPHY